MTNGGTHVEGLQPLRVVVVTWRPFLVVVVVVVVVLVFGASQVVRSAALARLGHGALKTTGR